MSNRLPIHGIYDEWEREETARRDQSDRLKDLFKRAKDEGYNAKSLRQAFAEWYALEHFTGEKLKKRERDASDVDLYLANLAGVRTREIIDEFDPVTGEIRGNGAGVAGDEVQVAAMRASSSANSSQSVDGAFTSHGRQTPFAGTGGEADRQLTHAPHYEAAE